AGNAPYNVVIVGSGQTGVELGAHLATAAACTDLSPASALPEVRIAIIEAIDTFMSGMADSVRETVQKKLRGAGVATHTGQQVSRVSGEAVETETGERFPADLTVWATGRVGPP